jgi:8-oxo-dGTP pyrophosphatase MutT (NUDIX family)
MTTNSNTDPILSGDWSASHWELFTADKLPDDAICTAVGCVAIVGLASQTVAMVRNTRSKSGWEMPAGHTEPGEQPVDTLRREALEEAGFVISAARLFAYRKITRSALADPATLTERDKSYPSLAYLPYYYAFTDNRAPVTGAEISESKDLTMAQLQQMSERGEVHKDELTIIQLGLQAAARETLQA